ncbi:MULTISPECIES: hypothetical protein [unclassified Pseudomonas]|uniref:hypothetical protein n=1 Tax=unclassified Pseudomonas TaxID=196821 RepID=UPI001AF3BC45|nr:MULTISPECIES: hypothetical protein [unclassified Pseudomonas]MCE0914391.1 hypothetical protein [Pseudomonas sp. NMI760_13]MCF1487037.1 hypothetical protein [Pseudomonas sp. AA27]MCP8632876.1 hypothetical protein [Pseudomonas sp. DVZ6]MDD7783413.1 hypothetical protein [Pseudomonas sp. DVZ24]BCJ04386.1 hypothetical protein PRtIB026_A05740 [Pseudomonas sp. RtIB026]
MTCVEQRVDQAAAPGSKLASALGRGTLNFPALVDAMQYTGWKGMVGFETRGGTLMGGVSHLNQLVAASTH